MKIIIHRGTHQIGGVATEICTDTTRLLIDMGDELSLDENFVSNPLSIPGITDDRGSCDAILFTHYHRDHIGQLNRIRPDIPLYMGELAKAVLLFTTKDGYEKSRIENANIFRPGEKFTIGDICITPFSIDHTACDSYMFLMEAGGKYVLHTGDFRMHGFRSRGLSKILNRLTGRIDLLITEGTTLSRQDVQPMTERELQQRIRRYIKQYKYVFVLCASTNLDRICAMSKAVPRGKYFLCDEWQAGLLDLVESYWGKYSPLYRNIKKTVYGDNLFEKARGCGFLMVVRDNQRFRDIIRKFDPDQSLMICSMWNGYRTRPGSTIPDFLRLTGSWETLHTSGHASPYDLKGFIEKTAPKAILLIHTDSPSSLKDLCPNRNILSLKDREVYDID